jgi:hypothetical protein
MRKLSPHEIKLWVLIGGILTIFALGTYAIVSAVRLVVGQVQQSAQKAEQVIRPVTDLSNGVATQLAQLLKPTPTVIINPLTIIHQVRSLARLETIQYTVEKVITAETGQGALAYLFGDRMLFVAHGIVIAGADLQKLALENLRVQNNILYIQIPDPEIFVATLDNEKSYVYNRDTGVLTRGDINLESLARRSAEQAIKEAAIDDGILKLARFNAENYLSRLLIEIGQYDEVIFIYPTPLPEQ